MEETLRVLNELERESVIAKYAIRGAIAATFYMEPVATFDLDVFVAFPSASETIVTLSPLYDHLNRKGYKAEREQVIVEGIPVQFLPAYNALVEEALREARDVPYGDTPTHVLRAEHLMAIMLQTYRPKDRVRLAQMLDEAEIDREYLTSILERHNLYAKWQEFRQLSER